MGGTESKQSILSKVDRVLERRRQQNNLAVAVVPTIDLTISSNKSRSETSSSQSSKSSGGLSFRSDDVPSLRTLGDRVFMNTSYALPTDTRENDRNVMTTFIINTAFGKVVHPPVADHLNAGGRVLDVGCGSASWTMSVANEFPMAHAVGIDIVPDFPSSIYPKNCSFEIVDILKWPMPFEDNSFDLINMQIMSPAIPSESYFGVLTELKRILKPGGWIQWIEGDCKGWKTGPATTEIMEKMARVLTTRAMDGNVGRRLESLLEEAGYDQIKPDLASFPLGKWGGAPGKVMVDNLLETISSIGPIISVVFGVTADQLAEVGADVVEEADHYKGYFNYHLAIARKPDA